MTILSAKYVDKYIQLVTDAIALSGFAKSLIHLLNAYYVPNTMLGARDTSLDEPL